MFEQLEVDRFYLYAARRYSLFCALKVAAYNSEWMTIIKSKDAPSLK